MSGLKCYRCGMERTYHNVQGISYCDECAEILFQHKADASEPISGPYKVFTEKDLKKSGYHGIIVGDAMIRYTVVGEGWSGGTKAWGFNTIDEADLRAAKLNAVYQELRVLKSRAEELRLKIEREPFYRIYIIVHGDPRAYARREGQNLRGRKDEIENRQFELFSDPVFVNFLRTHRHKIFLMATFEARALSILEDKISPQQYREKALRRAWIETEDEIVAQEEAIKRHLIKEIHLNKLQKELEQSVPEQYRDIVSKVFERHRQIGSPNKDPEIY